MSALVDRPWGYWMVLPSMHAGEGIVAMLEPYMRRIYDPYSNAHLITHVPRWAYELVCRMGTMPSQVTKKPVASSGWADAFEELVRQSSRFPSVLLAKEALLWCAEAVGYEEERARAVLTTWELSDHRPEEVLSLMDWKPPPEPPVDATLFEHLSNTWWGGTYKKIL